MDSTWTRRRFAAALIAGSVASSGVRAGDEQKTDSAAKPAEPAKEPAAQDATPTDLPPAPKVEDLLLLAVLQKYPMPGLNADRLRALRAGIARQLRSGEVLRAGLQNGDEPATVFRARRYA